MSLEKDKRSEHKGCLRMLGVILIILPLLKECHGIFQHSHKTIPTPSTSLPHTPIPPTPLPPISTPIPPENKIRLSESQKKLVNLITETSSYNLPIELIWAIGHQESSWNNQAVSHYSSVGAIGTFQIANFWINKWSKNIPPELQNIKEKLEEQGHVFSSNKEFLLSQEGNAAAFVYLLDIALERYQGEIIPTLAEYNGGPFMGRWWIQWINYAKKENINPLDFKNMPSNHLNKYLSLRETAVKNLAETVSKEGIPLDPNEKAIEVERYIMNIIYNLASTGINPLIPLEKNEHNQNSQKPQLPKTPKINFDTSFIEYITIKTPSPKTYTVKSGDTLSQIAEIYNMDIETLQKLNNIPDANKIYPGQVLTISVEINEIKVPIALVPYKVKNGDTLSRIAQEYHTSTNLILSYNKDQINNPNIIEKGTIFLIPIPITTYPTTQ